MSAGPGATSGAPALVVQWLDRRALGSAATAEALRRWKADVGVVASTSIEATPSVAELAAPALGTLVPRLGAANAEYAEDDPVRSLARRAAHLSATLLRVTGDRAGMQAIATASAPIYPDDSPQRVRARAEELAQCLTSDALDHPHANAPPVAARSSEPGPRARRLNRTQVAAAHLRIARRQISRRLASPRYLVKNFAALLLLGAARVRDLVRTATRRHPVRIFTFHRVSDLCRDGMTVSPHVFERQVAEIRKHHDVISLDAALRLLSGGARLRRPVAVLTFDDGYRSVFTHAFPILERFGETATCFVSTGLVSTAERFAHDETNAVRPYVPVMRWHQLRALAAAGWGIGGHTVSHPRLSQCDPVTLDRELREPLGILREQLDVRSPAFAYPFGGAGDITAAGRRHVVALGYSACLDDAGGENSAASNPFQLHRIELGGDHGELAWRSRVFGMDLSAWRERVRRPVQRALAAHAT